MCWNRQKRKSYRTCTKARKRIDFFYKQLLQHQLLNRTCFAIFFVSQITSFPSLAFYTFSIAISLLHFDRVTITFSLPSALPLSFRSTTQVCLPDKCNFITTVCQGWLEMCKVRLQSDEHLQQRKNIKSVFCTFVIWCYQCTVPPFVINLLLS